jgi:hypothetical protein
MAPDASRTTATARTVPPVKTHTYALAQTARRLVVEVSSRLRVLPETVLCDGLAVSIILVCEALAAGHQ